MGPHGLEGIDLGGILQLLGLFYRALLSLQHFGLADGVDDGNGDAQVLGMREWKFVDQIYVSFSRFVR
uniref:Uncharacterized protein n=1 Tax=Lepeophtheirus salmonis TaxID=72036 RepID=A0A0K2TZA1_LEPSM